MSAATKADLHSTFVLLGMCLVLAVAYGFRVYRMGEARFDRVERQGGSLLLGKRLMSMAYWGLQPVARALVASRISANTVTFTSLAMGLAAAVFLATGHFGIAAIVAGISAILDALDGMVARLTETSSPAGVVLDSSVDRYVEFFFIAGLVIYYRQVPVIQMLALLALLGAFMVSYSTAKAEALGVTPPRGHMRRPERALYLTLGAALSPITIFWIERPGEFAMPLAYPMVGALFLVAIFGNYSAVERLVAIARDAASAADPLAQKGEGSPPVRVVEFR